MANCLNYNCDALETHVRNDCGIYRQSGAKDLIIFECGVTITDPSDGAEILALIAANQAELVRNIKFGMEAPSAVEIDAPVACSPSVVVNYDRTASFTDPNVNADNITFYNSINSSNGRSFSYVMFKECAPTSPLVYLIDAEVVVKGGLVFPDTDTEFQRFEMQMAWRDKGDPTIHAVPAGVFV